MGLLELVLVILIIAAIFSRPVVALGMVFDFVIALLVIGLIYRLVMIFLR